ncbi:hypothetical protein BGZ92_001855 [Podila epicladia]|nr:hypothetical protein BGZ92_001855 [Podila epicladia]
MDAALTQHVCLVDRILDKRISSETGQSEYLLSWQGFDPQGNEFEDTWEPESNVLGEELIEEYERSLARHRSFQQKRTVEVHTGSKYQSRDPSYSNHYVPRHPQNLDHRHLESTNRHFSTLPPPRLYSLHHSHFPSYSQSEICRRPVYGRPTGSTIWPKRKSAQDNQQTNKENLIARQPVNGVYKEGSKQKDNTEGSRIKIMNLTNDTEKNYFKALIEKSRLIKDEVRGDLVQFLRNPKQPGLSEASPLLTSETWLMELNDKGDQGSLCIAMDIPNGIIKAMLIPRMHDQKMTDSVVITDRSIVLAVMAGDELLQKPRTGNPAFKCEWKDCSTQQQSMTMLSKHVQDHLPHSYNLDSDVNQPLDDQLSWRDRHELLEGAYRSLQADISKLRDLVSQGDVQIHDSNLLYQKSLKASIMYSKRLEARMEWEQTKWQQYAELTATMEKREPGSILSSRNPSNNDHPIVDNKVESSNTIREIHQLLIRAKEEQEILNERNIDLFQERQTLSIECKRIQESYDEVAGRLQELEAKHTITTDELKRRTANVETLRITMEQKREQTQATIEQLQSKIGELMSSPMQQKSTSQNSSKSLTDSISFQTKYDGGMADVSCKDVNLGNDSSETNNSTIIRPLMDPDAPALSATAPNSDPNNFINMLTKSIPQ